MKEHQVTQGTAEWYALRMGIPTASEFDKIITPGTQKPSASRFKYASRLIAERLLRWQADSLDDIEHIAEGKRKEPDAVEQLELATGLETRPCGFLTTDDGRFGASPDRLGKTGRVTVECKSPTVPKQFEYLLLGHDDAYRCQVQGQLFVAEADKAYFYSYHERTPGYLVETGRDEMFIAKLADALERFHDEMLLMLEKAQSLGLFLPYPAVMTPADVADTARDAANDSRDALDRFLDGEDYDDKAAA